tara:strand:- start:1437 stop:1616 length:180 start_codon:yes stop_codon:yes gene_type:complete
LIISTEGIARDLEEPFGLTKDHLNIKELVNAIEICINQILQASENCTVESGSFFVKKMA